MRQVLASVLFSACLCVGAAYAEDGCGPGCHSTVQGACVVNGWETGAVAWNECPAGAQPRQPCPQRYVWNRHARSCIPPSN
jgi:hypothetical protein